MSYSMCSMKRKLQIDMEHAKFAQFYSAGLILEFE